MTIVKLKATFTLALIMAPFEIMAGFGNWSDTNAIYIDLVAIAILLDWVLGTAKHWLWLHDFSWKENLKGLITKFLLVVAMGFVVEGLHYLTKDIGSITSSVIVILRTTVFMYPAMSIIRSSRIISGGKFPPQKIYDMIENWTEGIGNKKK
jgi:hypothetical protein